MSPTPRQRDGFIASARSTAPVLSRFVFLGALNTAFTTVVFVVLMWNLSYPIAYVLSFGLGIAINAWLVPIVVFRRQPNGPVSLAVGIWGLCIMSLGAMLSSLCERAGWAPIQTALAVGAIIVPLNFSVSRVLVHRNTASRPRTPEEPNR